MRVLGIDMGGSATKLAAIDESGVVCTSYVRGRNSADLAAAIAEIKPDFAAVTGVSSAGFDLESLGVPAKSVLEINAIAAGSRYLARVPECLAVSIGTGTAFVVCRENEVSHIGGTSYGGGVLSALCEKILGTTDPNVLAELCARGDLGNIDLLMSELPSCPPSLDPKLTAANLGKVSEKTSDADWALGIFNVVLETIGSMAWLAASGRDMKNIVFTGGPTAAPCCRELLAPFTRAYPANFIVPDHSECATAVGAAYCVFAENK